MDITRDMKERATGDLGFVSKAARGIALGSHATCSAVATDVLSTTTSLVGRYIYYQHLVSARKARDALECHFDGSTPDIRMVTSSYMGSYMRVVKSIFSS